MPTAPLRSRLAPHLLAIGVSLAAGALLLAPLPPETTGTSLVARFHLDKVAHALVFLLLGWLWRRSLARASGRRRYLTVLLALVAYGALLELAQQATGVRSAEWGDVAADALGAVLAPLVPLGRGQTGRTSAVDSK